MRLAVAMLLSLTAGLPAIAGAAGAKVKIAVTDIKNVQGVAQGTATILSDIVVSEVAAQGYAVISQSDIDAMLGFEKKKQMFGCAEETSCLAEIGGALGVEYLFTGQVGKIGSRFRISLLIVDARKAVVVARAAQFTDADEDDLARGSEKLVAQLLKEIAAIRQGAAVAAAQRPMEPVPAEPKVEPKKESKPDSKAQPVAKAAAVATVAPPPPTQPKLDLTAKPPATSTAPPSAPAPAQAGRGVNKGWWWIGGGGALLVVGTLAGLQARNEMTKLEDAWRLPPDQYQKEYDTRSQSANTLAVVADVSFVAGLASAGWGTWMLLRKEPGAVAVAPMPIDGGAAIVAAGRF